MSEPLTAPSITAKAAALAVACGTTVKSIHAIVHRYQGIGLITSSIAQELASVQCVWDLVQTLLSQRMTHGDMDRELLFRLDRTIQHGRQIVNWLDSELASSTSFLACTSEHGFRQRTRMIRNEKRWRSHQDRIRGQMMSMNLLIAMLRL